MVENLLKVIHVPEGLQQAEHLRMLNVYGLQPTKKKVRQIHSKVKTMLTMFFDREDVHHEDIPPGQTINKEYYLNVPHWLREPIQQNSRSYGQPVIGSFITTTCLLWHQVSCRVFCETSKHPGDSAPLQPRVGTLRLLAFPQTKITFEREEISDHQ